MIMNDNNNDDNEHNKHNKHVNIDIHSNRHLRVRADPRHRE